MSPQSPGFLQIHSNDRGICGFGNFYIYAYGEYLLELTRSSSSRNSQKVGGPRESTTRKGPEECRCPVKGGPSSYQKGQGPEECSFVIERGPSSTQKGQVSYESLLERGPSGSQKGQVQYESPLKQGPFCSSNGQQGAEECRVGLSEDVPAAKRPRVSVTQADDHWILVAS